MPPPFTAPFNAQDPATYSGAINALNYASIPANLKSQIDPLIESHHSRIAASTTPEDPALAEVHKAFTKARGTIASLLSMKMAHSLIAQAMATELENIACDFIFSSYYLTVLFAGQAARRYQGRS